MPTVLHVGCGLQPLPEWLDGYDEVRLDINPDVQPDIIASMTDLGDIGPFDAVLSCHTLEHLYPDEVPVALAEFRRVLKPGGFVTIIVPNLEGILPTEDVVYESPSGPISGLDMFYGCGAAIRDNRHMAHHCGFVMTTLRDVMERTGFDRFDVTTSNYNLLAVGVA
jgi:SAM-dependent methyltransferase